MLSILLCVKYRAIKLAYRSATIILGILAQFRHFRHLYLLGRKIPAETVVNVADNPLGKNRNQNNKNTT